jgi:hypothetical protein
LSSSEHVSDLSLFETIIEVCWMRLHCTCYLCVQSVFTEAERVLVTELRFEEIGTERHEEVMAATFINRQRWV